MRQERLLLCLRVKYGITGLQIDHGRKLYQVKAGFHAFRVDNEAVDHGRHLFNPLLSAPGFHVL